MSSVYIEFEHTGWTMKGEMVGRLWRIVRDRGGIVEEVGVTILTMPILTSTSLFCLHRGQHRAAKVLSHNPESVALCHTFPHFSALF